MKVAYWMDEYSREEGFVSYLDIEFDNLDYAIKTAKNLIDTDNFASVEVIENDIVLYGYDGVNEW